MSVESDALAISLTLGLIVLLGLIIFALAWMIGNEVTQRGVAERRLIAQQWAELLGLDLEEDKR